MHRARTLAALAAASALVLSPLTVGTAAAATTGSATITGGTLLEVPGGRNAVNVSFTYTCSSTLGIEGGGVSVTQGRVRADTSFTPTCDQQSHSATIGVIQTTLNHRLTGATFQPGTAQAGVALLDGSVRLLVIANSEVTLVNQL